MMSDVHNGESTNDPAAVIAERMPMASEAAVTEALRSVVEPNLHKDIVSLQIVKGIRVHEGDVAVLLALGAAANPLREKIEKDVREALGKVPGVTAVDVKIDAAPTPPAPAGPAQAARPPAKPPIQGVKNLIAVASGKGGVGKTTVAVNLAIALKNMGAAVGLLDADVYGPNVPVMLGTSEQPKMLDEKTIIPVQSYGVKMISMGLLSPGDKPLVWRGPMLHSVIQQFLRSVRWGTLDYLIVDLPPGTGDVQLTLIQTAPITGAVIVTTPSVVALADVRKAVEMFRQVNVEILGIVENMSYFACPHCNGKIDVF